MRKILSTTTKNINSVDTSQTCVACCLAKARDITLPGWQNLSGADAQVVIGVQKLFSEEFYPGGVLSRSIGYKSSGKFFDFTATFSLSMSVESTLPFLLGSSHKRLVVASYADRMPHAFLWTPVQDGAAIFDPAINHTTLVVGLGKERPSQLRAYLRERNVVSFCVFLLEGV